MNLYTRQPQIEPFEILYPDGDGKPMTESAPTRDYLIYRQTMELSATRIAEALGLTVEGVETGE
jgi:hypothetical protein